MGSAIINTMTTPKRSARRPNTLFIRLILVAFGLLLATGIVSAVLFGASNSIILTITTFILPTLGAVVALPPALSSLLGAAEPATEPSDDPHPPPPPSGRSRRLVYSILAGLLVISVVFNVVFIARGISSTHNTGYIGPQPTNTALARKAPSPSATAHVDSASKLIPPGQQPVINDPLHDNNQSYGWNTASSSSGSCNFVQGQYLLLSAPGGQMNGVGCNPTAPSTIFGNFVYQIEMTIISGLDTPSNSSVGPVFRVNTGGTGQEYQVSFDVAGNWQVTVDSTPLTGDICANPCPYFHRGYNQANFITILAAGSSIQVQINGYTLGSYTDTTYTSGFVGVLLSPGSDDSSVAFNNMLVWQV